MADSSIADEGEKNVASATNRNGEARLSPWTCWNQSQADDILRIPAISYTDEDRGSLKWTAFLSAYR